MKNTMPTSTRGTLLFVSSRDLTEYGFIGRPHYFIRYLTKKRFRVVLFNSPQYWKWRSREPSDEYRKFLSPAGVRIINGYPVRARSQVLYELLNLLPNILLILDLVRREKPRCIIIVNPIFGVLLPLFLLRRIPVIFDFEDFYPLLVAHGATGRARNKILSMLLFSASKIITDLALKVSDAVVACSIGLYDYARRVGAKRVFFIANGVDVRPTVAIKANLRRKYGLRDEDLVISYVGGIRLLDMDVLTRAVAKLRASGVRVRVLIAGDGPQMPEFRRKLEEEGIASCTILLGRVRKEEVTDVIGAADVCVSFFEQSEAPYLHPLKLMEYLYQCKPVVSTPIYGLERVLGEEVMSCIVFASNSDEFADAIIKMSRVAETPEFMEKAKKIKSIIESKFNWNELSKRFLDVVRLVMRET